MTPQFSGTKADWLALALRIGIFTFIAIAGLTIFGLLLVPLAGYLVGSAMSSFAAAAAANAISIRIYERGQLADVGLQWTSASRHNLWLGAAAGAGAALVILGGAVITGLASFERVPGARTNVPAIVFVSVVLLFGAVGEEMLFHGYGFQVLLRSMGPFATILPAGIVFGFAHLSNINIRLLGLVNTVGWGILLGYAFLRSGDLWLPIGLHFGWNFALPLFGASLSGFTMGMMGYNLHWKVGAAWSGGEYGPEGGLLVSGILVVLFYFLHRAPVQHQSASKSVEG